MKKEELGKLGFEEALQQLEVLVRDLESGRIKLDDAVEAYEKAVALRNHCEEKLRAARLKIEKIELSREGEPSLVPLDRIEEND